MKTTADYINEIIEAVSDSSCNLSDTLLKVKVVAHKLDNSRLMEWVEDELQGYGSKPVPQYRVVPAQMRGNMMQDRGFGGMLQRRNEILPVDALPGTMAQSCKRHDLTSSIFEITHMLSAEGSIQLHLPVQIGFYITEKTLANGWQIENCWKEISRNSLQNIVGAVKNQLLTLMLELSRSLRELEKLEVSVKTQRIDDMVKNTIGEINGGTVNINFGDKVVQAGSSGSNNLVNAQAGDSNEMVVPTQALSEVRALVEEIKSQMARATVPDDQVAKIQAQLDLIGEELMTPEPKATIVSGLLQNVHGLLLGVAGNVFTPVVIEQVNNLVSQLSS